MFIDHFAASFIESSWLAGERFFTYPFYLTLRLIGRMAFPIYAFLLVEGYRHTGNVWRYLGRLTLFGLVSELPFDLAFYRQPLYWGHQNVFFTLALGLLALWLWDRSVNTQAVGSTLLRYLLALLSLAAVSGAAYYLRTDYAQWGILTVAAFYLFSESEWKRGAVSACALLASSELEAAGFVDYLLFHFYSGQRGRQSKYFFYAFYPAHLLLLSLVCKLVFRV